MQASVKQQLTLILLLGAALTASLKLYCLINPFYIPTVDDSAIVMRYLVNFQHGHFFSYNVEDGPVYGISCFWLGLTAGTLSWAGLDPQAALMTVALASTILFFFAALRVFQFTTGNAYLSIFLGAGIYYAALFIPRTMFLGLETPLHLWLITEMILAFLKKQARLFYVLSAICIISKLDAAFMVAFLSLVRLYEAHKEAAIANEIKKVTQFFVIPMLAWLVIATLIFGNPIPQSFLSKFFLREKAPKTSWFPFLEPLINSPKNLRSVLLMLSSMVVAIGLRVSNKVSDQASSTFAILCMGTMALYYVYNPGERMAWYYALPEFLALMSVACLPVAIFRSSAMGFPGKTIWLLISISLLVAATRIRAPMNRGATKAAPAWQIVYEKERRDSGLLANAVAPTANPVLWTGHGYPAYLFKGYVADYAGLNFNKIWTAVNETRHPTPASLAFFRGLGLSDQEIHDPATVEYKSGLLLMKNHGTNVYMQHSLFSAGIQRGRNMRLAGSFYTVALVGAPGLRVFVEDQSWGKITVPVPDTDIKAESVPTDPNQLWRQGRTIQIRAPKGASELLFGVEKGKQPNTAFIKTQQGLNLTCSVPAIENTLQAPEVQACKANFAPLDSNTDFQISSAPSDPIRIYEPSVTVPSK